jgi:hypothetical protein
MARDHEPVMSSRLMAAHRLLSVCLGAIFAAHISKVRGSLISGPVNEAAIGRRTPGSTATS